MDSTFINMIYGILPGNDLTFSVNKNKNKIVSKQQRA